MNILKIIAPFIVILVLGIMSTSITFGQVTAPIANIGGPAQVIGPQTVGQAMDYVRTIVRIVYILFFIIAALMIIMAAFSYLTAGGDTDKLNSAKDKVIYAAVAITVALLAVGFEVIIRNFLVMPGS